MAERTEGLVIRATALEQVVHRFHGLFCAYEQREWNKGVSIVGNSPCKRSCVTAAQFAFPTHVSKQARGKYSNYLLVKTGFK